MNKPELTIIIPSRNEEKIIVKTLDQLKKNVKTPHEVVVVDDSSDDTQSVVKKYFKKNKNVRLVGNESNSVSFGKALELGVKHSRTDVVVVVMADLCDNPKTISRMYKKIEQGWDVVCGSRYMEGGSKEGGPRLQSVLSKLVCLSLRLITGVPTLDVSNAFKMYKKTALSGIKFNSQSGVEASMEVLFQVYFAGAKITEIPTNWKGRTVGSSKFKILKRAPRYFRIYRWAVTNRVKQVFGLPINSFYV